MRAFAVLACSMVAFVAAASERATPDEAKAMLQKAAAHYKAVGRKRALADFSAKKAGFGDRDLYVVCIDGARRISANGAFPMFVDTSADVLKDAGGRPLGAAIIDAGKGKDGGAVRYMMANPTTGKTEPKIMFAQKLAEDTCGVGAYNPK
jgi:cytochrome c